MDVVDRDHVRRNIAPSHVEYTLPLVCLLNTLHCLLIAENLEGEISPACRATQQSFTAIGVPGRPFILSLSDCGAAGFLGQGSVSGASANKNWELLSETGTEKFKSFQVRDANKISEKKEITNVVQLFINKKIPFLNISADTLVVLVIILYSLIPKKWQTDQ